MRICEFGILGRLVENYKICMSIIHFKHLDFIYKISFQNYKYLPKTLIFLNLLLFFDN